MENSRLRIYLIKESTTVIFGEDSSKAPRLLVQRLNILNLQHQNIAWLRSLNIERARQVVDFGEVDIAHVVGAIIVSNLSTCPVYAFDFDYLAVLDSSNGWYYSLLDLSLHVGEAVFTVGVPAVLKTCQ